MSGGHPEDPAPDDVLAQDEAETLEGELRAAKQERRAALERVKETQAEVDALLARARRLIERRRG